LEESEREIADSSGQPEYKYASNEEMLEVIGRFEKAR
jgi:hypothetical protein